MTASYAGWLFAALAAGSTVITGWRLVCFRRSVARVEHELRGPLAAIRFAVDLGLRQDGLGGRRLRAIGAEMHRAELALGDLARARHGDAPTIAVTDVDLCEVATDSVEAWRSAAGARGVNLELCCDAGCALVLGDPTRLAQATGNLIANAIEHGGPWVRVRAANGEAGVKLEVTDDGPGLPSGVLARIARSSLGSRPSSRWSRRARVREQQRRRDGRGQGLAIVAGIACAHGGRLSAPVGAEQAGETSKGQSVHDDARRPGASLVLELPAAPSALRDHTRPGLGVPKEFTEGPIG